MLEAADQRALVERARSGDQAAWNILVEQLSGLVWTVVRGHHLPVADAADVVQTVWLRAVEHLDRVREPERFAAWLATTARHECYRVTRRNQRLRPTAEVESSVEPAGDFSADVARALDREGERADYLDALERLSEGCRVLLRLLVADPPLSYDEISEVLAMPRGSIGPTRQRCLDRLRRSIEERHSGSGG